MRVIQGSLGKEDMVLVIMEGHNWGTSISLCGFLIPWGYVLVVGGTVVEGYPPPQVVRRVLPMVGNACVRALSGWRYLCPG
eukprot:12389947-Ditylum_brightwellii.AAC.1